MKKKKRKRSIRRSKAEDPNAYQTRAEPKATQQVKSIGDPFHLVVLAVFILIGLSALIVPQIKFTKWPLRSNPSVMVSTKYSRATAEKIEKDVCTPLEKEFHTLPKVDYIASSALPGESLTVVGFQADADLKKSLTRLREAADRVQRQLPSQVTIEFEPYTSDALPVYRLAIIAGARLVGPAERLKNRIEALEQVKFVEILGEKKRRVFIRVKQDAISKLGISISQVRESLSQANFKLSLGSVESSTQIDCLDMETTICDLKELKQYPVMAKNGRNISLGEIAKVKEQAEFSEIMRAGNSEKFAQSVMLQVYAWENGNPWQMVKEIDAIVAKWQAAPENENPQIIKILPNSGTASEEKIIRQRVAISLVLVFIVFFLAFRFRIALLAGLCLVFTLWLSLSLLSYLEYSLNYFSVTTLLIALGFSLCEITYIADRAHYNLRRKPNVQSALKSTLRRHSGVGAIIVFSALALLAPVFWYARSHGAYLRVFPLLLSFAIIASYLVTTVVFPVFGQKWLKSIEPKITPERLRQEKSLKTFVDLAGEAYADMADMAVTGGKKRAMAWCFLAVVLFAAGLLLPSLLEKRDYAKQDAQIFNVNMTLTPGTPICETERIAKKIEKKLLAQAEIGSVVTSIGKFSTPVSVRCENALDKRSGSNMAGFTVLLKKRENPHFRNCLAIIDELKEILGKEVLNARFRFDHTALAPFEKPQIVIRISASERSRCDDLAQKVLQKLHQMQGVIAIRSDQADDSPALLLSPVASRLSQKRIELRDFHRELYAATCGQELFPLNNAASPQVILCYDWKAGNSPRDIYQLGHFPVADGKSWSYLSYLASTSSVAHPSEIRRFKGKRTITITAGLAPGKKSGQIHAKLSEFIDNMEKPPGDFVVLESGKKAGMTTLIWVMAGVLLLLIFPLLGVYFRSLSMAFLVTITLPLASSGVLLGCFLAGTPVTVPIKICIPIIALVYGRQALLLLNEMRDVATRVSIKDTIYHSIATHFRAAAISSLAVTLAMTPFFFHALWRPVALSITFGVLSFLFVLLFIPAFYLLRFGEKSKKTVKTKKTVPVDEEWEEL